MPKEDTSELVDAAAAFDQELAAYARLGDLFVKTPLASVKHLERANTTLGEIAACEERVQAAGQHLVRALAAARSQQEELSAAVVAHVPAVQARNQRLHELMGELTAVAGEVGGLNAVIGKTGNGDAATPPSPLEALEVANTVLGLSSRAEQLATAAHAAEFEELGAQAHALHQRLAAIGKKLAKAGGA